MINYLNVFIFRLINLNYIFSVPLCTLISIPCVYIWLNSLSSVDEVYASQYKFSCYAMAISCILELTAEAPAFIAQVFCFVKLKVILDTFHIFIRSILFIFLVSNNKENAILAFGIAQFSSAVTIVLGNYLFFYYYIRKLNLYRAELNEKKCDENMLIGIHGPYYKNMDDFPFNSIKEFIPGVLHNDSTLFNSDLQVLVFSFIKQGILKQVLTEGEKYVMSVSHVLKFSEQAIYDIVNNMGSLAARFIFRPIEDSSYFYFTQTIARDIELKDQPQEKVLEAAKVLSNICRTVSSIGLLAFVFGQSYAGTLLYLYGGADFVEGGLPETLLKWHCLAIVLLAVNGITEGYMFATNTSKDINTYNYYMAMFSVTFLILSYQLTNFFGPVGFILANCCNMFFRISYSIYYIKKEYKYMHINPLDGFLPGKIFLPTLILMGFICKTSQVRVLKRSIIGHLLIGVLCTIITIIAWAFENRELLYLAIEKFKKKKKSE